MRLRRELRLNDGPSRRSPRPPDKSVSNVGYSIQMRHQTFLRGPKCCLENVDCNLHKTSK